VKNLTAAIEGTAAGGGGAPTMTGGSVMQNLVNAMPQAPKFGASRGLNGG
jgi:hypothetical protein